MNRAPKEFEHCVVRFYLNKGDSVVIMCVITYPEQRRLLTIVHYSLYKISSFALGRSAA